MYNIIRLSADILCAVRVCLFPHGFSSSSSNGDTVDDAANETQKHRLSSGNPVSRNDNVDDALNIIEIEVALVNKNIQVAFFVST